MEDDFKYKCRLCVQKCSEISFHIFPQSNKEIQRDDISIPMRIAAVIAIEIKENDGLPVKMCGQCRYRLELSYYFKKRSQIADAKLRKHYKLLSHGKKSNVFSNEEDDCEELLEDSLRFLRSYEDERDNEIRNRISIDLHQESQKQLESLRTELSRNLRIELENDVKNEMRQKFELKLQQECFEKAREELKQECIDRYRKEEYKNIINEMQEFLKTKQLQIKNDSNAIIKDLKINEDRNYIDIEVVSNAQNQIAVLSETQRNLLTRKNSEICSKPEQNVKPDIKIPSDIPFKDIGNQTENEPNEITYEIEEADDFQISDTEHSIVEQIDEITVLNYSNEQNILKSCGDQLETIQIIDNGNIENQNLTKSNFYEKEVNTRKVKESDNNLILSQTSNLGTIPLRVGRQTVTPKMFECKFCPLSTSTKNSLERHLRVHSNEDKSVACPECKIVVSCRSALRRHVILHSGQRPYICGECGKAFAQKEILKRHENTQHKGLRMHKCTYCERQFSQKINLTEHIRQHHLGEGKLQRYKCHLCSKSFCHSSGLSRHLALHSGITYQCVECMRTFADRSSVKRHILNVHGLEKTQQMIIEIGENKLQT